MIRLSRRLQAIADFIPIGFRVADVGTDHAFLPCYLVQNGLIPSGIGIDIRKGPLESAERTVNACQLKDKISLRFGNGLAPLQAGEVEAAIIAGMGGNTIIEILDGSPQVVDVLQCLILQPMSGAENLRGWLTEHAWCITNEELLQEDGHYYQIIKAVPGQGQSLTEMERLYGPLLIARKHPLLPELIEKDLAALQDIKKQLAKSQSIDAMSRSQELRRKVELIKELRECLLTAIQ